MTQCDVISDFDMTSSQGAVSSFENVNCVISGQATSVKSEFGKLNKVSTLKPERCNYRTRWHISHWAGGGRNKLT